MKPGVIVDTNVPIAANGDSSQADATCQLACIERLLAIRQGQRVYVDQFGLILDEYRRHLAPSGQPSAGDAFFKWLWDRQADNDVCRMVTITSTGDDRRAFSEFPNDAELRSFDRSDQKFVAVALASQESPPIINATDTDWWAARVILESHGVTIEFVCPKLMSAPMISNGNR